jgi:EF hand domain-containing protein
MRWHDADERREGATTPLPAFAPRQHRGRSFDARAILSPLSMGACLLWSALASAQVIDARDYLERVDVDHDGRISLPEYQAWMGYAFEHMDTNGDGLLTAEELPGGTGKTISLAEHRESLAAMFLRQDADGDGFLDARELAAPPR